MYNSKPTFYFDVEIKRRELLSRLTVAALLAEKGHHVFIGERVTVDSLRKSVPCATVIKKSARANGVAIINDLKDIGCKVINMEEEGVLVGSLDEYINKNMPSNAVKSPDRHFLWGDKQLKELQHLYPELTDKFQLVGNPRLSLWQSKYYGYYNDLSAKIKEEFGEFVLISSNFAIYSNKRLVKEMAAIVGLLNSRDNVATYADQVKVVEFLYNEFIKAAKAISMTGMKVVFRPHPSESVHKIQEDFSGYDNVVVSSEHDVAPWVLASKAVIHNCCTTGLESVLMEQNTIAYTPNSISMYKLNEVNQIAKVATNVGELLDCISSPAKFAFSKISLGGYLHTEATLDDIVNNLEKVQTKANFELSKASISPIRYKLNKIFYVNARKLKDALIFSKLMKQEINTSRGKFPVTDNAELKDYLSFIYDVGLLKKMVTCAPVERNMFYIYCEDKE